MYPRVVFYVLLFAASLWLTLELQQTNTKEEAGGREGLGGGVGDKPQYKRRVVWEVTTCQKLHATCQWHWGTGSRLDEKGCCYSSPAPQTSSQKRRQREMLVDVSIEGRRAESLHHKYYTKASVHVTCLISVSSVTIVSRRCRGGGGELRNAPASLTTGSNAASKTMKVVPVKLFIFIWKIWKISSKAVKSESGSNFCILNPKSSLKCIIILLNIHVKRKNSHRSYQEGAQLAYWAWRRARNRHLGWTLELAARLILLQSERTCWAVKVTRSRSWEECPCRWWAGQSPQLYAGCPPPYCGLARTRSHRSPGIHTVRMRVFSTTMGKKQTKCVTGYHL